MPVYQIELPNGAVYEIDAPDDASANAAAQTLVGPGKFEPDVPVPGTERRPGRAQAQADAVERDDPGFMDYLTGAGEAALTTVTGATSGTVGQVGGFLGGLAGAIRTGEFGTQEGARRVQQVTENAARNLTYAPRTEQGQRQARAVGEAVAATAPFTPIATEIAATVGNAVRGVRNVGVPRARAAVSSAVPERVRRARANARLEPSISDPSVRVPPEVAAAERAAKYASDRVGVPLVDLPAEIRAQITRVARDAKALEGLDPAAIRRQATLASLPAPVPATRGQLTRNLAQIKREENIRATDLGEPLMDVMARQDEALAANLKTMRGRAQATTPQQTGRSVQGALARKLKALEARRDDLYDQAREAGAMAAPVEVSLLDEWLQVPANQRNAGWLESALKTYRDGPNGRVTINDLENIRQEVTAAAREPGRGGYYAGQALGVIDDILDNAASASEAGSPYRVARAAHRALKQEFTNQSLIDRLTNKKRGSLDRRVALEDTIDTVLRSSSEQIGSLRHSLLTGGTAETRRAGLQAWRDVRGGVINRLRDRALNSRGEGVENAAGQSQFNGGAFLREFDALDADGVLAEMFTTKELKTLRNLRKAVEYTRTTPAGRFSGSDTTPRLLAMLERYGSKLPIGDIGRGVVRKVVEMQEEGQAVRRAQEAVTPPLAEAAQRPPPKPRSMSLRDLIADPDQP